MWHYFLKYEKGLLLTHTVRPTNVCGLSSTRFFYILTSVSSDIIMIFYNIFMSRIFEIKNLCIRALLPLYQRTIITNFLYFLYNFLRCALFLHHWLGRRIFRSERTARERTLSFWSENLMCAHELFICLDPDSPSQPEDNYNEKKHS